jgi:hypothetical protein
VLAIWDISSEIEPLENEFSGHPIKQIITDTRSKYGLGNNFILLVIPVRASQEQFWEQLKFKSISSI